MNNEPNKHAPRKLKLGKSIREKAESEKKPKRIKLRVKLYSVTLKPLFKSLASIHHKLLKYKLYKIISKFFYLIGLILWPRFIRNSFSELSQVEWPSRRETFKLTLAVIIFSVFFGAFVAGLDFGLTRFFKYILLK